MFVLNKSHTKTYCEPAGSDHPSRDDVFVGPSGSGKTTLLRLFLNKMITPLLRSELRIRDGYCRNPFGGASSQGDDAFSSRILFPGIFGTIWRSVSSCKASLSPRSANVGDAGTGAVGKRTVWTADKLSGGEKQRWVLARVCLLEPEVYLLTNPPPPWTMPQRTPLSPGGHHSKASENAAVQGSPTSI